MSTITCNEEKKGNANLRHPLGDLGVTHQNLQSLPNPLKYDVG